MVGILLPPSVAGALVNFAALLMGKVPVNLNYTASNEIAGLLRRQCDLEDGRHLARLPGAVSSRSCPRRAVLLEDLAAGPRAQREAGGGPDDVAAAGAAAGESCVGARTRCGLDDLATVIFSSGSTGDPKGVMLTHYNIVSNVEQIGQIFALGGSDRILGILPFFHSFGFTGDLWLPAALGVGVVYHPNPLDAKAIGELVQQVRA